DGDEAKIFRAQKRKKGDVAKGVDVGDGADGVGDCEGGIGEAFEEPAQVGGVFLEADGDLAGVRAAWAHGGDGPVGGAVAEGGEGAVEVGDPRGDAALEFGEEGSGVGDPFF